MSFEKDLNRRRDIIKKVIAYMTLGIDVSALFSEMCKVRLISTPSFHYRLRELMILYKRK